MSKNEATHPVIPVPGDHIPATDQLQEQELKLFSKPVISWGLWDWGSAAFNAVVTTFVFSTYITNAKLFGPDANTYLGWTLTVAGLLVAAVAPALGHWVDRSGKSRTVLITFTLMTALVVTGLFWVSPNEGRLWLGLFLLGAGNITFEISSVVYNSMINDIASEKNVGRVSGFGWGLGYVGGIVLLLILFIGFISPEVGWFGVTSENGLNVRVAMLFAAAWLFLFSLPVFFTAKNKAPKKSDAHSSGIIGAYRDVFHSIKRIWNDDRSIVWFLISSAIYRDGLAGVFSFGAVLAAVAFDFSPSEVILFGVAANVVAGIATIAFGYLDDKLGSRFVIIVSVSLLIAFGLIIFIFHNGAFGLTGKQIYWVFGMGLSIFVGPTQAASRTYLARIAPKGDEAELFGLYATTGRAVSFLAPFMYSTAIVSAAMITGQAKDDVAYAGILGVVFVLALGLITFIPVKDPAKKQ
ncbi:MAG: MFS transporter [Arcanobacterium sp.]|nr:MFS transporter [Arcanobacterium sp.]